MLDHNRALQCVQDNWLGPVPIFNDRQFERTFRITRKVADQILQVAGESLLFFQEGSDALGNRKISPQVKLLMALKMLAYGCSPSAFVDYFQIGETTARRCMNTLTRTLAQSETLRLLFLRPLSRADARRVVALHEDAHGVPRMIGSLDCTHVGWRTCPVAWKGQFQRKGQMPTIILEAMADHSLWIWHHAFGFAGTLNDINVFDQSTLLKSFLDGSFSQNVDFDFEIAGTKFTKLFILVDGIYPEISRFAKTIEEPLEESHKQYATWHKASRKDIKRAFGVLKRKFLILAKPFESWYVQDISNIVECCLLLHNMMISERISRDETEGDNWYEFPHTEELASMGPGEGDPDEEHVLQQQAELELQRRLEAAYYQGTGVNLQGADEHCRRNAAHYSILLDVANRRWFRLYNCENHYKLKQAVIQHVSQK